MQRITLDFKLLVVVIFALLVRIIFLDQYPIGITHDELNYVISGKSIFWTGGFAPGTAPAILPSGMQNYTVTVAEVPSLLLAPIVGPFQNSLLLSRLLGAILSSLTVLLIYFICLHLTKNKIISLITSILLAINPWSFLMGRTIFETNFFVTFFLAGFLILIRQTGWKVFYAAPFYLLGFFSYTGGQLTFYLFIIISLFYKYSLEKKLKPLLVLFILITAVLVIYLISVLNNQSYASRGGELYLPTNPKIQEVVDNERKIAVQTPLNNLFINKATIYLKGFGEKYLNAFSVNNLFLNGELRAAFSFQKHGTFYFIDIFFIILGVAYLFSVNKKSWFTIIAILSVSTVTSGLSVVENSYSQRSALMFPFLVILLGMGVGYLTTLPKFRVPLITLTSLIYLVLFINLLHLYFFRFPIYASDGWFFQDRILSQYIRLTANKFPDKKIVVSTFEPKIVFEEYLFFTNIYHGEKIIEINENLSKKIYAFENVTFTTDCLDANLPDNTVWIAESFLGCKSLYNRDGVIRITRFRDVYENYLIKGDLLCKDTLLSPYTPIGSFNNLNIETQTNLCQNWITKI